MEVSTGYAVNKNLASGAPVHVAYDIRIKNRLFVKPQIGYKYLKYYNDFTGGTIKGPIRELHQTLSYEVIKKNKYVFKPNVGVNYRWYHWQGEMHPPLNTLPERAWVIEFRDGWLELNSFGRPRDEYRINNWGFTIQLQNQFKLTNKVWLHVTPFIEPDYDGIQNTGGCYVGVILKQKQ